MFVLVHPYSYTTSFPMPLFGPTGPASNLGNFDEELQSGTRDDIDGLLENVSWARFHDEIFTGPPILETSPTTAPTRGRKRGKPSQAKSFAAQTIC